MKTLRATLVVLACLCVAISAFAANQKLTAEEVIARHLESLGTAQARAAVKSRASQADVAMDVATPARHANGAAMLVSLGRQVSLQIKSNGSDFPNEQFVTDGNMQRIGMIAPNTRSPLGDWFYRHEEILKEGLVGGTLTTAWALQDVKAHQAKVSYEGLKNVDGRELHDLLYVPKKSDSDLRIHLYFEPETFRHVKTVYTFVANAAMDHNLNNNRNTRGGSSPAASRMETRYTLEERFEDFRTLDGVTLPAKWQMRYTYDGNITATAVYSFTIGNMRHNVVTD